MCRACFLNFSSANPTSHTPNSYIHLQPLYLQPRHAPQFSLSRHMRTRLSVHTIIHIAHGFRFSRFPLASSLSLVTVPSLHQTVPTAPSSLVLSSVSGSVFLCSSTCDLSLLFASPAALLSILAEGQSPRWSDVIDCLLLSWICSCLPLIFSLVLSIFFHRGQKTAVPSYSLQYWPSVGVSMSAFPSVICLVHSPCCLLSCFFVCPFFSIDLPCLSFPLWEQLMFPHLAQGIRLWWWIRVFLAFSVSLSLLFTPYPLTYITSGSLSLIYLSSPDCSCPYISTSLSILPLPRFAQLTRFTLKSLSCIPRIFLTLMAPFPFVPAPSAKLDLECPRLAYLLPSMPHLQLLPRLPPL
jgi:hypothetical protein